MDPDSPQTLPSAANAEPRAPNPAGYEELPGRVAGDVPEAFAELFEAVGSQTEIHVSVSRLEEGSGKWALVHQGARVLSAHEVGTTFGAGEYRETVQWRTQGATRGPMKKRDVSFIIGREYGLGKATQQHSQPAAPDASKELERVLDMTGKVMALARPAADSTGPVLQLVERLMERMDRMQERTDAKFEKLIDVMTAKAAAPPSAAAPIDPMSQLRELIAFGKEMGVPVVSQMGENESKPVWMEAVEMVAGNVGKFLEMLTEAQKGKAAQMRLLATSKQARTVYAAKTHLENPETRAKMIEQLDAKVGAETTDKILKGLGVTR